MTLAQIDPALYSELVALYWGTHAWEGRERAAVAGEVGEPWAISELALWLSIGRW
jgi:hypothetical protein